ncbi:PAAR domain-containing protein [Acinetobacter stercoris]|nr:PAAR domain-containing protein [Acinetobacter stercoris]
MQKPEKFLKDLSVEDMKMLSQQEIDQMFETESQYFNSLSQTRYYFAVDGAKTKNGGIVHTTSQVKIGGISVACVGDEVVYPDDTTSKIKNGCGDASVYDGRSLAIVGSQLENGDEIIETLQDGACIRIFEGQTPPKGFLS